MSKPENISIKNQNFFAWRYEEQTKIKHLVLKNYFKVWVSKLGSKNNTLFFDCHGGCGVYIDNKENLSFGSSILAEQTAQAVNSKRESKNAVIVCEVKKEYFNNLKEVVKFALPESKFNFINEDFNKVVINTKINSWYTKYPTLFFVDPFGFDLKIANLKNLLNSFGNELIINYMYDYINRFIELPDLENTISDYYGCTTWKNALNLSRKEREEFLVKLYKTQIKEYTKARYVFAYRLCYPDKDRTYYYLFHATNKIEGISIMKSCFANINNGRIEYLGKRSDEYTFFDLDPFIVGEVESFLLNKFKSISISFDEIIEAIIEDTAYLEPQLRQTIRSMEKSQKIKIDRVDSKNYGIKGKDIITFGS